MKNENLINDDITDAVIRAGEIDTALTVSVSQAHIAELQKQLAEAHATIARLNKRGGYTLQNMIDHANRARFDELEQEGIRRAAAQEQSKIDSLVVGKSHADLLAATARPKGQA